MELADTLGDAWQGLVRGAADRRHAYHWPIVCTVSPHGAEGRVVVLRGVDRPRRTLWFHTDRRSAKLEQLPGLSWVFYDSRARLQLRVHGETRVADEAATDTEWVRLPLSSRKTYLVNPAPGTPLGPRSSGLPDALSDRLPTAAESEAGRSAFAVVVTTVTRIESLRLARSGHERAFFSWDPATEAFAGTWLVP